MKEMTLESLVEEARAASAGLGLTEASSGPPEATIKEVRARAKEAAKKLDKASKALSDVIDFLNKEDVGSSVMTPVTRNSLEKAQTKVSTWASMARDVAKSWPDYRVKNWP